MQSRKPQHREVWPLSQGHPASNRQSKTLKPGLSSAQVSHPLATSVASKETHCPWGLSSREESQLKNFSGKKTQSLVCSICQVVNTPTVATGVTSLKMAWEETHTVGLRKPCQPGGGHCCPTGLPTVPHAEPGWDRQACNCSENKPSLKGPHSGSGLSLRGVETSSGSLESGASRT